MAGYSLRFLLLFLILSLTACNPLDFFGQAHRGRTLPGLPGTTLIRTYPATIDSMEIWSASSIALSWIPGDRHSTGFDIQRSTDDRNFLTIASLPADANSYQDTDVPQGNVRYYYRVVSSYDPSGDFDASQRFSRSESVFLWYFDACTQTPVVDEMQATGGQYVAPISGMNYQTSAGNSVTDADGRFNYVSGQPLRFYLGYTQIAEFVPTAAGDHYNPLHLAGNIAGVDNIRLDEIISLNLSRFLLTLDTDHDPLNGIQLPCEVSTLDRGINFSLDYASFENQPVVTGLILPGTMMTPDQARLAMQNLINLHLTGTYTIYYGFPAPYGDDTVSFLITNSGNITSVNGMLGIVNTTELRYESDLTIVLNSLSIDPVFGWIINTLVKMSVGHDNTVTGHADLDGNSIYPHHNSDVTGGRI